MIATFLPRRKALDMFLERLDRIHLYRNHASPKILARYSHIRVEAKRKALDGLAPLSESGRRAERLSHGTNDVTKGGPQDSNMSQLIERNGGTTRLELATSAVTALK